MRVPLLLTPLVLVAGCVAEPDPEPREPYPPEHCAYFLTGEVDLDGVDADGDGVPNGWDHCPNNAHDWLDSDRDGIGNKSDPDLDGDGVDNDLDEDRDGDGVSDADEAVAGTDPSDPARIPALFTLDHDPGIHRAGPGWYRGDLHVHTEHSHDSSEPLSNWGPVAAQAGLDFLAITDHRNVLAFEDEAWAATDQVVLLPGMEWGGPGHANVWGLRTDNTTDWDDRDAVQASWSRARLQGAVQSLNHYGNDDDALYWDSILADRPELLQGLDAVEVWNVWWPLGGSQNNAAIAFWEGLLEQGHRLAAVGGSDVHASGFPVGFPTTVVGAQSLSVPGILHGIRSGRTYVANGFPYTPGPRDAPYNQAATPVLVFEVDADGDGEYEATMGDAVPRQALRFHVNVEHAWGPIRVYRNRELLRTLEGHGEDSTADYTFSDTPVEAGWYRLEMRSGPADDDDLLLFSSAIYVD